MRRGRDSILDSRLLTVSQGDRAFLRIDGKQSALIANIRLRDQADLRAQLWHTTAHLDSVSVAHWSMWFYRIHDTIWRDLPADSNDRRRTIQQRQQHAAHARRSSLSPKLRFGEIFKWRDLARISIETNQNEGIFVPIGQSKVSNSKNRTLSVQVIAVRILIYINKSNHA